MNKQNITWNDGERFLRSCLQRELTFNVNNKAPKRGRLLLFKRNHFFIQITLLGVRGTRENFEIPFPYKLELHEDENLMYLDYRLSSLKLSTPITFSQKISSNYHNKILEVQVIS